MRRVFAIAIGFLLLATCEAGAVCLRNVAQHPSLHLATLRRAELAQGQVGITYVGHSTFLIETTGGARIATDYNDYVRARVVPDIVTMNIAHSTHYSRNIERGVKHVLPGWGSEAEPPKHELTYLDVQVRNVPTNIREGGGTAYNGNSIFIFETAGLCIAHLGHLHHRLTPAHLQQLGHIDVMFVPVDGTWTLGQEEMMEVVDQVAPQIIIPMHYFGEHTLLRFIDKMLGISRLAYHLRMHDSSKLTITREIQAGARELVILRAQRY
jgi:L-ascorbate metabolism protein UlaG (beta-lactamase superfamily)